MKRIKFSYAVHLTTNNHVHSHSYLFRCIPLETPAQKVETCQFQIDPCTIPSRSVDAFGNHVLSGYIEEGHRFLDFSVQGVLQRDDALAKTDFMPCYHYPSPMTQPDEALRKFEQELHSDESAQRSIRETAAAYMHAVFQHMDYEKDCTDITTTAAEAFASAKGVCQDYTHILLSLLRLANIPCRYIAGLAFCDGETHAWAEVWDGEKWFGVDPTNDCFTDEGYLVLAQGRDSNDAALNRGVMFGAYSKQMQLVESNLETLL